MRFFVHIDQKNRSFIVLLLVCDDDSHTVVSFGPHILCSAPTYEVDVWVISDNTVPVWPLTSLPPPSRHKKQRFHGFFHPISESPLATWQSHEAAPQTESDSSLSLSPTSGLSSSTGKSVSLITLGNCIFSPAYLPNTPRSSPELGSLGIFSKRRRRGVIEVSAAAVFGLQRLWEKQQQQQQVVPPPVMEVSFSLM